MHPSSTLQSGGYPHFTRDPASDTVQSRRMEVGVMIRITRLRVRFMHICISMDDLPRYSRIDKNRKTRPG